MIVSMARSPVKRGMVNPGIAQIISEVMTEQIIAAKRAFPALFCFVEVTSVGLLISHIIMADESMGGYSMNRHMTLPFN